MKKYLNIRNTIYSLMDLNVVPIINENDTTSTEEIRFGDNDKLSAMIANALSAELLILLSDVNGLYTANPKKSLQAKLITSVEEVDQQIEKYIDKDLSEFGSGGMLAKINAAKLCIQSGSTMITQPGITSGLDPFFIISDTDGNGFPELIFTDEWVKPGPVYKIRGLGSAYEYYDFSNVYIDDSLNEIWNPILRVGYTEPLGCTHVVSDTSKFLYLKFAGDYAVSSGSEIAEVSIQIRYTFHDALGGDIDEVDDPKAGIWGFFVVDEDGSVVSSSVYIYQQLSVIEDTWPPNENFISVSAYLPIPDRNETFYIAWGVTDPYLYRHVSCQLSSSCGYISDLDYTLRVEWIGMWYLHR
jgi:hypothetical protein